MAADGHLLLVLHVPPKPNEPNRVGQFFWRAPDGKWISKDIGSGINSLNAHLDEYADVIAKLEDQDENASMAEDLFWLLEQLALVHRSSRNLHHVL